MFLRHFCCGVLLFGTTIYLSSVANATVFLHDQFLEDGILANKVPMPGPGTAWNPGSATGVNAVTVVNGEAVLIQTEAINGEDIANIFGDQSATATTYARFDFRLPSAENSAALASDPDLMTTGDYFFALRGTSPSMTLRARTGIISPVGGGDFRFAINADNSDVAAGGIWPTELSFDTTYRAVISFDASIAESKLWINPVDESSTNVSHTGVAGSIGTIINRVILRQNNDFEGKQFIDNVVAASTFAEALNPDGGIDGDFNSDGKVDAADYVWWRKNDGTQAKYDLWRANFGAMAGRGSLFSTTVPEPATALLLTISGALLGGMRRIARS